MKPIAHYRKRIPTPTGPMILAATDEALLALVWDESDLDARGLGPILKGESEPMHRAERQLGEYFQGKRKRFDIDLDPIGTDFQRKVWAELAKIPYGETRSYSDLARGVGNPAATRAVGSANGRNPLCIIVPCHRVVRASGDIGGYAGGLERKEFLLALESQ